ncbi:CEP19-like protein-domain-containing protein [Pavlovales sp. CCMP2436]|nr:CEP19-like protein-domain-containing protein [Pavlovales sp. CCMP2436]
MSSTTMVPRKFGLTFVPPALTVVYTVDGRKTRRRIIPVRNVTPEADVSALAAGLAKAHADLLGPTLVQHAQIERLVERLVEATRRRAALAQSSASKSAAGVGVSGDANLNQLDDAALTAVKATMDVGFNASRLKVGDPGYEYDKRVEFAKPAGRSDWDDDLEDYSSSDEEDLFGKGDVFKLLS